MSKSSTIDHKVHLAQFEQDGFTIYQNVLDEDLITEIREHIEWCREKLTVTTQKPFAIHDAFFARLVSDPRLLEIAEKYMFSLSTASKRGFWAEIQVSDL